MEKARVNVNAISCLAFSLISAYRFCVCVFLFFIYFTALENNKLQEGCIVYTHCMNHEVKSTLHSIHRVYLHLLYLEPCNICCLNDITKYEILISVVMFIYLFPLNEKTRSKMKIAKY